MLNSLINRLSRVTSSGSFIAEIDGMRFFAILGVLLLHLNGQIRSCAHVPLPHSRIGDFIDFIFSHGNLGVMLFFAISGFILALPFARTFLCKAPMQPLGRYFLRRLTRLEPPYIINLLAALVLRFVASGQSLVLLLPHMLASVFYVHNAVYHEPSTINGVAWSLEIEVQFYILAPLMAQVYRIRSTIARRLIFVAAGFGVIALEPYAPFISRLNLLGRLQFFLVGMLLADIYLMNWRENPIRSFSWDAISGLAWLLIIPVNIVPVINSYLLPIAIFVACIGAFRGILLGRVMRNRWLVTIGGMCYTIYLYHYFTLSCLCPIAARITCGLSGWSYILLQIVLVGPAVLAVCAAAFAMFEKPFMYRDWPAHILRIIRKRTY